jgi:uncharacterized cupin superfamily protein
MSKTRIDFIGGKDATAFSVMGDTYRILATAAETEEAYTAIDMLVPPGGGPGPHSHPDMEECFYIVEGEVEFGSEDGFSTARTGDFVRIPKGGLIHQFQNTSRVPARMLCLARPAGIERLFEEVGKPVQAGEVLPKPQPGPDELQRLTSIAERHGQTLYPPDYLEKYRK